MLKTKFSEQQKSLLNIELHDIVESLNYTNIVCYVNPNDYDKLLKQLKKDHCNHLYNFEHIKKNNFFYIENCDLQYTSGYEFDDDDTEYVFASISFTKNGFILKELIYET